MNLDFKKLLTARFLFTFAVQMQAVVLGWRIYEIMKDPLYLGLIGLTEALPAIGLALFAGYIVDRSRPLVIYRRVMYVSFISGLIVLIEHFLSSHLDSTQQILLLYSASFLTGLARSFSQPSMFASVPHLVDRENMVQASAQMSSALQIARIAGPASGGLIFGYLGAITSSSLVCLLLFGGIIQMFQIKKEILPPNQKDHSVSLKTELLSGLKFVFHHPILFPALSLDMIAVLFGGVTALLPVFASEVLFVGEKGLGWLRASPAIGATVMSLYLAQKKLKGNSGPWLFTAVTGFGVCILLFGLSTNFWLSLFALALSGAFDSISMVIRSAAVQLSSPDHMRGKISAVNSIFIGSSNEIGELESGIAAKLFGVVPSVYIGGIICLSTVGIVAWLSPTLRKLNLDELNKEAK